MLKFAVFPFLLVALSTPAGAIGVGAVRLAVDDCDDPASSENGEVDNLIHNAQSSYDYMGEQRRRDLEMRNRSREHQQRELEASRNRQSEQSLRDREMRNRLREHQQRELEASRNRQREERLRAQELQDRIRLDEQRQQREMRSRNRRSYY